jgi:Mrp family chromosome partitioning ATPase
MRPAISLIGVSSGSSPVGSSTVSYAIATAPESITARVSSSEAAKWK